jgi:ribosomal protein S27AE
MSLKRIEVRCQNCHQWFDSGIKIPESYEFEADALIGMLKECPRCGENTHFSKQNMRVRPARETDSAP